MTQNELNNALLEKTKIIQEWLETIEKRLAIYSENIDNLSKRCDALLNITEVQNSLIENLNGRIEKLENPIS